MTDYLSASQLVMFQRCAEQWRRRFLEEDFAPPAIPVLVGRTVREVALAALRRKLDATPSHPPKNSPILPPTLQPSRSRRRVRRA